MKPPQTHIISNIFKAEALIVTRVLNHNDERLGKLKSSLPKRRSALPGLNCTSQSQTAHPFLKTGTGTFL